MVRNLAVLKKLCRLAALGSLLSASELHTKSDELLTPAAYHISLDTAQRVADKIWQNECNGSIKGLTSWNKGENFASLGIGHFIWYPEQEKGPFQESFPQLVVFLKEKGATLPVWLESQKSCPWKTRQDFYQAIESPKMQSLRTFLIETKHLQALYMARQLEDALPKMLKQLSASQRKHVIFVFNRLINNPPGLYALMDYLNFKGLGCQSKEEYQGKGWGLLQVLLDCPATSQTDENRVADFVMAAKNILTQRVKNAPPERHEERWLKGWHARLDTY